MSLIIDIHDLKNGKASIASKYNIWQTLGTNNHSKFQFLMNAHPRRIIEFYNAFNDESGLNFLLKKLNNYKY
jgi:hypothetical protein